jgi:hypothetical protein
MDYSVKIKYEQYRFIIVANLNGIDNFILTPLDKTGIECLVKAIKEFLEDNVINDTDEIQLIRSNNDESIAIYVYESDEDDDPDVKIFWFNDYK